MAPGILLTASMVVAVAATDTARGLDPYSLIGTVVTPVLVLILLMAKRLHTHGEVERLESDLARERADNAAMRDWWREQGFPMLSRNTHVLEALDAANWSRRRSGGGDGGD